MLDHLLEQDCEDIHCTVLEEKFFEKYLLPMHLKEKKYVQMAIDEDLTFDEVVEAIYANEYESYLNQGRDEDYYEEIEEA